MQLNFDETGYLVSAEGLVIPLLPKEYALLVFLYRHKGLVFTREHLLDQVWPMEYPVERTVDDHVYRLRKKLASLHGLGIRTVRGQGYSLTVPDHTGIQDMAPAAHDPVLNQAMRDVFGKYHQYGQFRSMLILGRQQEVLGYELDPFYAVYLHFVQGDLEWLLVTEQYPWESRFYYLLLIYSYTGNPAQRLAYCEEVLKHHLLPEEQHNELELLNIVDLFLLNGQLDRAVEQLGKTEQFIAGHPDYANFLPQSVITLMLVHVAAGSEDAVVEQLAVELETSILVSKPFLREAGSFRIVTGLWRLRQGRRVEAEMLLDEGLSVLDKSGYLPMQLHALHRIVHFLVKFPSGSGLQVKYRTMFEASYERIIKGRLLQVLEEKMGQVFLRVSESKNRGSISTSG